MLHRLVYPIDWTGAGEHVMRIASSGRLFYSITMIGLGIVGLLYRNFVPVWNPILANIPVREVFVYLGPLISLASGIGLLVPQLAAVAARSLLTTLLLWLLLFRLPNFLLISPFEACWSVFPLIVMLAAAWVLYVWFAADWDRQHLSLISGSNGLRIARVLYGFSLIFFGLAHFIDVKDTLSLIPNWLPEHAFWAYFTGGAFIAAGVAVLVGRCARLAAVLSALQIGLFLLLVWVPIVAAGSKIPFQWSETILNAALLAAAWVIAESYRDVLWLNSTPTSGS